MGLTFQEAAALGPLVRLNGASCPAHGPVYPEALAFPLTASSAALQRMAGYMTSCMERGCEETIEVDAEPASEPLHQHLVLYFGDTIDELWSLGFIDAIERDEIKAGRMRWPGRVVCDLRRLPDGRFAQGYRLEQDGHRGESLVGAEG